MREVGGVTRVASSDSLSRIIERREMGEGGAVGSRRAPAKF